MSGFCRLKLYFIETLGGLEVKFYELVIKRQGSGGNGVDDNIWASFWFGQRFRWGQFKAVFACSALPDVMIFV